MDPEIVRELNRQVRRLASQLGDDYDETYGFICECGCGETVTLTASEFDRGDGTWLDGHEPR